MTQLTTFNPSQLPAHLRTSELSDATKALMGNSSGFRLSIKGNVFRLLSNGKEYAKIPDRTLDVVVVGAAKHVSRTFYLKQFDEDSDPTAPDCTSADGEVPDKRSAKPQAARLCTSAATVARASDRLSTRSTAAPIRKYGGRGIWSAQACQRGCSPSRSDNRSRW